MRLRRPRFTVRQLTALVAFTALVLAGPIEIIRYKFRERALICRRLVEQAEAVLPGIEGRVESLEWRIAKFQQQNPRDPRHEQWLNELAYERGLASRVRAEIPVFWRVSLRPWEPIPTNPTFGDLELGADDHKLIDQGSTGWITSALAIALGAALLIGILMGRLPLLNQNRTASL